MVIVADGLGHGILAAEASRTACLIFRDHVSRSPEEILQRVHAALRSTRGAAVAVAEVDVVRENVRYAGVGNIAGCILNHSTSRSMVSHNGTLGHHATRFQGFDYPFSRGSTLLMHSDGLASRWNLDGYPGLLTHAPALLAGVLYRDHRRGRDDVTVVAVRPEN